MDSDNQPPFYSVIASAAVIVCLFVAYVAVAHADQAQVNAEADAKEAIDSAFDHGLEIGRQEGGRAAIRLSCDNLR